MIEGIIGRPGAGKSYLMTRRALQEADRGRVVFVNWGIVHPNVFYFEPDQMLDLPPGLVMIDEAHLWFPARMAMRLPMSWLTMMSQTRKKGWDVVWATQHEKRVDSMIRDVSHWLWLTSAWLSVDGHPVAFRQQSFEPEFFRVPKKKLQTNWFLYSKRVAAAYDTHESLLQAAHTHQVDDAYAGKSKTAGKRNASVLDGIL